MYSQPSLGAGCCWVLHSLVCSLHAAKAEAQANLSKRQCVVAGASRVVVQVVKEGGVYANGQVVVQPLPTAIYGGDALRTIPLRRLEAVLTEEQLEVQCAKEMQKVQRCPINVVKLSCLSLS